MNLKDRLRLIKTTGRKPETAPSPGKPPPEFPNAKDKVHTPATSQEFTGWRCEGDFVRSRTVTFDKTAAGIGTAPAFSAISAALVAPELSAPALDGLCALIPDVGRYFTREKTNETDQAYQKSKTLKASDITFFDLETTGLSGGAGTVAFLAAFGKMAENKAELTVTQYLLLDYPGEELFLRKCLEHLNGLVVTYNGKSFDSQIMKNRCIMNAIPPPFYHHADLVHPARYFWKRKLPSCRQRDIEEMALGLNREDDLPGSFAPDAWFHFLKTSEKTNLLKICAHNAADIAGLAAIWNMFARIAASPLTAWHRYHADIEHLALRYRNFVKRRRREDRAVPLIMEETTFKLLEAAAAEGGEIAQLLWAKRYGAQLF
jgi:uncharacterized protein YprB with RNaseH-like and TPR domain